MPLSNDISTRLTRLTGASLPSGCQIKASVAERSGALARCGASRSSALAIRSRTASLPLALALGVDRRGGFDFDLARDFVLSGIGEVLTGARHPRKPGRPEMGQNGRF
jgi:hypothetical protein